MELSVALCTYNGEKYISEQLDSILNQALAVNEIIIVDDGSSDSTLAIIERYASLHPLIKVYRNQNTLGYLKNFEKSINRCSGDIVFLCDQDDIWLKEKTQSICNLFAEHPHISCIVSDLKLVDASGAALNRTFFETLFVNAPVCKRKSDAINFLIDNGNFAVGAGMAFKKQQVAFREGTVFAHDAQLMISALKQDALYVDETAYTCYRIHEAQSIGIRHTTMEKGNAMLEAYERYKRAAYIYSVLGNGAEALDKLKKDFLIRKNEYLQKFDYFGRLLRKLKWYVFPPFDVS